MKEGNSQYVLGLLLSRAKILCSKRIHGRSLSDKNACRRYAYAIKKIMQTNNSGFKDQVKALIKKSDHPDTVKDVMRSDLNGFFKRSGSPRSTRSPSPRKTSPSFISSNSMSDDSMKKFINKAVKSDEDDDDVPLSAFIKKRSPAKGKSAEDDDDDVPLSAFIKKRSPTKGKSAEDDDDDVPLSAFIKKRSPAKRKNAKPKDDDKMREFISKAIPENKSISPSHSPEREIGPTYDAYGDYGMYDSGASEYATDDDIYGPSIDEKYLYGVGSFDHLRSEANKVEELMGGMIGTIDIMDEDWASDVADAILKIQPSKVSAHIGELTDYRAALKILAKYMSDRKVEEVKNHLRILQNLIRRLKYVSKKSLSKSKSPKRARRKIPAATR